MDRHTLREAIIRLSALEVGPESSTYAHRQAVLQYNALLGSAKSLHPLRQDIQPLDIYNVSTRIDKADLKDAIRRLRDAVDIPVSTAADLLHMIVLPPDAPPGLQTDLEELNAAVGWELPKVALLLAGSVAEALLLSRHPDTSDRGPGLSLLVKQATTHRLFGRDTLRALETLVDYRDLIHTRTETRNRTPPTMARVETAITALRLLCSDLADTTIRYS